MSHFLNSSDPPPEIRNQQVDGSSPFAGSTQATIRQRLTGILRRLGLRADPVGSLSGSLSDDLATEQRIAEFTRRMQNR